MGALEDFPVSEFAKRRAKREINNLLGIEDPTERLTQLILNSVNGLDMMEGYSGEPTELVMGGIKQFTHGVRVAVRTFLSLDFKPDEDMLVERALEVWLGSSALMEAGYEAQGKDIADLYLHVDGGNG